MGAEKTIWNGLKSAAQDFKLRTIQKGEDWKEIGKKVKEGRMNEIDLNKRALLKVAGLGFVAGLATSCTPKAIEFITATPKKESEVKMHSGLLYKKDIAVFKVEDGFGMRATLEGFDFIPETQDLSKMAFIGLKFGQGEPSGQVLVKDRISGILPGLNEAMIAYDSQGVEKSGLLSINDNLFVLTRVGEGANNTLAMFAPNYKTIKYNSDGSASIDANMTTRDGNGKWRIESNIMISITLAFDADGKLTSYTVPVLNPSFQPTREADQRAGIIIPKNISFVSQELKVEVTKTPAPTATKAPEATAQPTNTPAPTEKPTQAPTQQPKPTERPTTIPATPKPDGQGTPFSEGGINGLRSGAPIPGKDPRFPNSYRAADCTVNPVCPNSGLQFATLKNAEDYFRGRYPNAVLSYEYWLFDDGGVSKVIVKMTGK